MDLDGSGLFIIIPCYNEEEILLVTAPMFLEKLNFLISEGVSVWTQLGRCQRLFYTDDICNMQEYEVGQDIVKEIESLGGDSQAKLIFLGKWDAPLNDSCLK